jgi:hypothetical protein
MPSQRDAIAERILRESRRSGSDRRTSTDKRGGSSRKLGGMRSSLIAITETSASRSPKPRVVRVALKALRSRPS